MQNDDKVDEKIKTIRDVCSFCKAEGKEEEQELFFVSKHWGQYTNRYFYNYECKAKHINSYLYSNDRYGNIFRIKNDGLVLEVY